MKDLQPEPHRVDRDFACEPLRRWLPFAPDGSEIRMSELADD